MGHSQEFPKGVSNNRMNVKQKSGGVATDADKSYIHARFKIKLILNQSASYIAGPYSYTYVMSIK